MTLTRTFRFLTIWNGDGDSRPVSAMLLNIAAQP